MIIKTPITDIRTDMKKTLTFFAVLATTLTATAQIKVAVHETAQDQPVIPAEIYGQFSEHLGKCIYEGIWVGKDSPIPNVDGYRTDVLEAFKALKIPVLRWPGGCFADEYHWMDGIGPQENRKKLVNNNWGSTVEDNSFGTHEFLNLCEMLGIEPYISGNVGSGTVEEMAKWVEYMNSDTNSTMAELRRKNGREKPWNVKYFGVGNESWGCGGNMKIEYYTNLYRRYNTYARNYGENRLFRIASGANGGDTHWMDVAMKECRHNMDGISVHFYAVRDWGTEDDPITGIPMGKKGSALQYNDQQYYEIVSKSLEIEDIIRKHCAVMDKYDPKKNVAIMFDEWGTWYNVEPGTNPGWLYQQNTMRDAVIAASSLDIFHKYTDRVKMANIAQVVNVLQSMILTNEKNPEDGCVLTPTYYVFKMYKAHKEGKFVPGELTCEKIRVNDKEQVPVVSQSASVKEGVLSISLSNLDVAKSHVVAVNLDGKKCGAVKNAEVLTSKDVHAHNDFGTPNAVSTQAFKDYKVKKDGTMTVTIPAHSVVTLSLQL